MTPEEIQKLKEKLPHGWTRRLSKMAGVTVRTVSKVFNGLSENTEVLNAAIKLIEEEQQRKTKIQKILKG